VSFSFSVLPVVELLKFINIQSFPAKKYHRISLRPFGLGQSLNPYLFSLQNQPSLFILFFYPLCRFAPCG
jgi:hypothetical protein